MKIVFFGTPSYVLPILDKLYKTFKSPSGESPLVAVVTQKPKPVGREKIIRYSPVDTWAHKKSIVVYFDSKDLLINNVSADLGIVASYGKIIPNEVIKSFLHGIINIHFSLLPELRGASPVESAILQGHKEIGVSIFKIDNKLEHGPIINQFKEEVRVQDTTETLRSRLFEKSAEVLTTLLPAYVSGKITLTEQNHKKASFTSEVKKVDAFVPPKYLRACLKGEKVKGRWEISFIRDFTIRPTPTNIYNFIRAMQPWPVSWTYVKLNSKVKSEKQKRLKILNAHIEGTKLILDKVQLEGKNPVSWKQFQEGYPNATFL
jgi:methionyl-tRNA formyltransferase